jgi:hypothetical protein
MRTDRRRCAVLIMAQLGEKSFWLCAAEDVEQVQSQACPLIRYTWCVHLLRRCRRGQVVHCGVSIMDPARRLQWVLRLAPHMPARPMRMVATAISRPLPPRRPQVLLTRSFLNT